MSGRRMAREGELKVRQFEAERDIAAVEEMERQSDVCPGASDGKDNAGKKRKGHPVLISCDDLGDPLCRVRHCPDHVMLVAERGKEIVGVIRASIKILTRGRKDSEGFSCLLQAAYILGLRVSPRHRWALRLCWLEPWKSTWCRKRGAEYAYMATERSNAACLNLFTVKFSYSPFRFPRVLVHPVHAHPLTLTGGSLRAATILRLPPPLAEALYRRLFSTSSEFFPRDINAVLSNPLTLGTFLAIPGATSQWDDLRRGDVTRGALPPSFALMSLWNGKKVYTMRVAGASATARALVRWVRAADERMPWMGIPSTPDTVRPFGVYLMYGIHAEGSAGAALTRCLCRLAHNMAREDAGCAAVVAEVGRSDPVLAGVPHRRRLSWEEDVWCMKKLAEPAGRHGEDVDWVKSHPSTDVVFLDPRDF